MRNRFRNYIFEKYGAKDGDTFCVNYKAYEHGRLVESISIDRAIDLMVEYYDDMKLFVPDVDDDRLAASVERTFDKHFIVF